MHVRPIAVALAVATVAATLLGLRVLESAGRILGWLAMAAAVAAIVTPAVSSLARRMPRGLAIAMVAAGSFGAVAAVSYGLVEDVVEQAALLEREAPRRAAELERTGRLAGAAREARLSERVEDFVSEVPARLRGGTPADAVRSAATRGLAFLAVTVLTIFLVLHGPQLLDAARRQLPRAHQRDLAARITAAVERRAVGYARGTAGIAIAAGAVAFVLATAAGVPGPVPLAAWVALWDVVPLIGAVVGALPIVALAAIASPARGMLLAVAFVGWQVLEHFVLQRPLEQRTVRVGPFLTVAAALAGLELYGLAGALLAVLAAAIAVVAVDEIAPSDARVAEPHGDE